jgi:hypothetical protein
MKNASKTSPSELVRNYAVRTYVSPARRHCDKTVSVNVGTVHKAVGLANRVPLVCTALESQKFQRANHLRLISKTGPPSGQSTTVTYTYELLESPPEAGGLDAWDRLRGALKDIYAEYGGGEAYLRVERASFRDASEHK